MWPGLSHLTRKAVPHITKLESKVRDGTANPLRTWQLNYVFFGSFLTFKARQWRDWWPFRLPFAPKVVLQSSHLKGFSIKWTALLCLLSVPWSTKSFLQRLQVASLIFKWIFLKCFSAWKFDSNFLSHCRHGKSLIFKWTPFTCRFKSFGSLKDFSLGKQGKVLSPVISSCVLMIYCVLNN